MKLHNRYFLIDNSVFIAPIPEPLKDNYSLQDAEGNEVANFSFKDLHDKNPNILGGSRKVVIDDNGTNVDCWVGKETDVLWSVEDILSLHVDNAKVYNKIYNHKEILQVLTENEVISE